MNKPPRILLIAGEVSGDMRAAELVRALRKLHPDVEIFGIGGDNLRAAGMEIVYDVRDTAVLGLFEVLRRYRFLRRMFNDLLRLARTRQPDLALLVDYPGFNLRFARRAHALDLRVVYYICPQVWAWHRARIPEMARNVDRLLTIFPFEPAVFAGTPLRVEFVGHPLVDETRAAREAGAKAESGERINEEHPSRAPRIALLPGSRRQEIENILPALAAAANRLARQYPRADFSIAAPSEEVAVIARRVLARCAAGAARLNVVAGRTREILGQADAAWVASGTATIEAAMMNCPMVVVYRTHWTTYLLGRCLIRVPFLGMVNVIAGRALCPELIQQNCTPVRLVQAIKPLLTPSPQRDAMRSGLAEIRQALGGGGAADRAAAAVAEELAHASAKRA